MVHLNRDAAVGSAAAAGSNAADMRRNEEAKVDPKALQKLSMLRKEVSTMKEKVSTMKGMLNDIKSNSNSAANTANLDLSHPNDHLSGHILPTGELERITCSPSTSKAQSDRMNKRFVEWWSHSACPDQAWMEGIHTIFDVANAISNKQVVLDSSDGRKPFLVLDIGCNKGYTSADFLDALSPGTNMNPNSLVHAIRSIAKEDNTKYDRDGGVCNDSDKPLNEDRESVRGVEVHCFEPSPATYQMLTRAHAKLMPREDGGGGGTAKWHIHNVGLHEVNGQMAWHKACASAVGDELCTIVPEGTEDAITVPVVTVDKFLEDTYQSTSASTLPLVHMLKIDAEGLDPAVLTGSTQLLTQNRAVMVMFEFNPGLSEKENPHGMWGKNGNPHKDLLEVTSWLDTLGYDCYLDTRIPKGKEVGKVPDAPALYRITGDCLVEEPRVRGWANVVCASRKFGSVAWGLRRLATMVE
eukprot:scaffold107_cov215-Alexandrium_tamarense.AAC.18